MRRSKRGAKAEHVNHERWLISYADFITLLFAFFVVMYSVSSINVGKYKAASNSIESAFQRPARSLDPIQIGSINSSSEEKGDVDKKYAIPSMISQGEELKKSLKGLIEQSLVSVTVAPDWLEIKLPAQVLFQKGSAGPGAGLDIILKEVASTLKKSPYSIRVEGFTDNLPIKNEYYPSNWELASARAATVVRMLLDQGIDSARLSASAYAENFPIDSNSSEEGRSKNRRVVIFVQRVDERLQILKEQQYFPLPSGKNAEFVPVLRPLIDDKTKAPSSPQTQEQA